MADYTSRVLINVNPNSSYTAAIPETSSLTIRWNYPNCQKNWFRVAGDCFQPPPKDGCPPYPDPGAAPPNCLVQDFTLTNLFNTGLDANHDPLAVCAEDRHTAILPSQYSITVDQSTIPPGLTAPTINYQYIGLACNGAVPAATAYTFRFFFVMPTNVAVTTLELQMILDSPNELVGVSINGKPAGLASPAPLIAKSFVLAGLFKEDVNFIDVTLTTPASPDPGYMVLMARFPGASACVSNGDFPPGVNTGCRVNFLSNVLACDAEDVCRILKERGLIFPIKSIKKIDSTSLDYNCYTDVTPTLEDCVECCDFLIDENIEDDWYGFCGAIEEFQYNDNFALEFAPKSVNRIVFKHRSTMNLQFSSESEQEVQYGAYNAKINISVAPESILRRSDWDWSSQVDLSFDPSSVYASNSYEFSSSLFFALSPKSRATPKTKIRGRMKMAVTPQSSYESINYYRSKFAIGFIPQSSNDVFGYYYKGQARAEFAPGSISKSSAWSYPSRFAFALNATYKSKWNFDSTTNVYLAPKSGYRVTYFGKTRAAISLSPESSVPVATAWSWSGNTAISLRSLTTYISSDLGTLETDAYAEVAAIEQPVIFDQVPAPPIPTAISSISIPGCCPLVLERLQFRHNLGSIPRFSDFLKRNGITVPGQLVKGRSPTFIPVTYSARQGQWTGSLFFEGLSASQSGRETWNLSIEFGCDTSWRIAVRLFRSSTLSDGSFRLVATYAPTTVCPTQVGFQGFSAAIATSSQISAPSARSVVVNDEEDIAEVVPSALLLQFSVETSGLQITFPVDLEKQLKAATAALF